MRLLFPVNTGEIEAKSERDRNQETVHLNWFGSIFQRPDVGIVHTFSIHQVGK